MCSFLMVHVVGWAQRCWPFFSKCSIGGVTFVVAMAITAADGFDMSQPFFSGCVIGVGATQVISAIFVASRCSAC